MNPKLHDLLLTLKQLRAEVPQLVFFAGIFPNAVVLLRKEIRHFKKNNPEVKEVDFILHSPGGLADDAYRIIRTLRSNFETVNIIIPFWAKSAATLLSLGGTKIIVDEFGEFGPIDAQIAKAREDGPNYNRESALNDEHSVSILENRFKMMYEQMFIRRYEHDQINIPKTELSEQLLTNLSKFFRPLLSQIDPYKLGEKKRTLDIGAQYAKRILLQFGSPKTEDSARELVDYLIHECPDHGYVIDRAVMENFVSNIYDSNIFGNAYKEALEDLSIYLIDDKEDVGLLGFVDDKANKAEDDSCSEDKEVVDNEVDPTVSHGSTNGENRDGEEFVKEVIAVATEIDDSLKKQN